MYLRNAYQERLRVIPASSDEYRLWRTPLPPKTAPRLVCNPLRQTPSLHTKPIHTASSSGEWVLSQSAKTTSIRVCHPSPDARNASTTCGDSRSDNGIFVGAFCGPRTPVFARNDAGNAAPPRLNVLTSAAVSLRTSPLSSIMGLHAGIAIYLSRISFTKTDHANSIMGFSETENMQAIVEIPQRDVPYFPINTPIIRADQRCLEIEFCCPFER